MFKNCSLGLYIGLDLLLTATDRKTTKIIKKKKAMLTTVALTLTFRLC